MRWMEDIRCVTGRSVVDDIKQLVQDIKKSDYYRKRTNVY